jgi:hypothetical protein
MRHGAARAAEIVGAAVLLASGHHASAGPPSGYRCGSDGAPVFGKVAGAPMTRLTRATRRTTRSAFGVPRAGRPRRRHHLRRPAPRWTPKRSAAPATRPRAQPRPRPTRTATAPCTTPARRSCSTARAATAGTPRAAPSSEPCTRPPTRTPRRTGCTSRAASRACRAAALASGRCTRRAAGHRATTTRRPRCFARHTTAALTLAEQLYERACDAEDVLGCVGQAVRLAARGGTDNDRAAAKLYDRACNAGPAEACNDLGVLIAAGRGATNDPYAQDLPGCRRPARIAPALTAAASAERRGARAILAA